MPFLSFGPAPGQTDDQWLEQQADYWLSEGFSRKTVAMAHTALELWITAEDLDGDTKAAFILEREARRLQ